ncbi:mevalonate kinase [Thiomicrorhabdus sp. zzn3]|uniref:mevalonate kinase n=1 Tax=Thiomicrorhabdus sp. zzn3 TaxID=3039775 RepID=UPI002436406A|nr:mevalonate kinase [Thiomicrorhabdus sp. zzn3]MDG6778551.1 mevalonate kinase [Thiomicrorhabdus sp. zzn3]
MKPSIKEPFDNWISRAPANLMLLGEHSVVYGQPALACSVDRFIEMEWQRTDDSIICIDSALGQYSFTLTELKNESSKLDHPKLRFVLHALKTFAGDLEHGLQIEIRSEFSDTIGLGSSAAVLAATLVGLNQITQLNHDLAALFALGHQIILQIQGRGSGTDLAASLNGGVLFFEPQNSNRPAQFHSIEQHPLERITLIYSGYKTSTAEVLQHVAEHWQSQPDLLEQLYALMGNTTRQAMQALTEGQFKEFFALCNVYQGLMDALGVSDATLSQLVYQLRARNNIQAAKISGSGLGDCVIGFGSLDTHNAPSSQSNPLLNDYLQLDVGVTPVGAHCDPLTTKRSAD